MTTQVSYSGQFYTRFRWLLALCAMVFLLPQGAAAREKGKTGKMTASSILWYRKPAAEWKEGLPIGNGVLAGMVLGDPERDRVALNHEWLWRGKNRHRELEARDPAKLAEIRRLFFAGKVMEAGTLANETFGGLGGVSGQPNRVDPYQPLGDLFLAFEGEGADGYERRLDLNQAVATVNGATVRREYLAHSRYPVIAVHLTGKEPFNAVAALSRITDPECRITPWAKGDAFGFDGAFPEGVRFAAQCRVFAENGAQLSPEADKAALHLSGCRDAVLLLTAAVTFDGGDPAEKCRAQFAGVPHSWRELLAAHTRAYAERYGRVQLDLGGEAAASVPTDERMAALRAGKADEALLALYFNYGRYLLISSSWGASLPANLQGKWNEELRPPWECDLHNDINLQMNYWPAEVCNLSECTEPLFAYLERFVPNGREVAKKLYNCEGIYLPIQTDPWSRATPEARGWDTWTGAAAWLAQHFWWRYEYGQDKAFLRDHAYPFFKEVAAFYESYLVRDPQGRLVPVPSQSPENRFVGGTSPVSLCVGATMDLELIHDVLTHAIRASEILNVDAEKRTRWQVILKELPPLQIGKHGQLQEWLEDYDEVEPGHRHISHLFAFFPGDQITEEETPALAQAARVSLERRLDQKGGHTGWSRAWTVCCFARMREGEKAYHHLRALVSDFATDSLLDLHPPRIFQIDGNLGGTAGIAEMLLQSHNGVIRILPALPPEWKQGSVSGLCARGGFVADIRWADGRPKQVKLHARNAGRCCLALPQPAKARVRCGEKDVPVTQDAPGRLSWQCAAGKSYTVTLAQ